MATTYSRKLIRLSPTTSVVSLPAAWLRKRRLPKGATLTVIDRGDALIVQPTSAPTRKDASIDVSGLSEREVWLAIDAAYVAGNDRIAIRTRDRAQATRMERVSQYFPGLIVDEERADTVVLRDMAGEPTADIASVVTRIGHATLALLEDARTAIDRREWSVLADAKRRDYHINAYASLALRQLGKHGHEHPGPVHTRIVLLEGIADRVCALLIAVGAARRADAHTRELIDGLHGAYRAATQAGTDLARFERDLARLRAAAERAPVPVAVRATSLLDALWDLVERDAIARIGAT